MDRLFRSLLKAGLCLLEESDRATANIRDRAEDVRDSAKDRIEDLTSRTRRALRSQQTPWLRDALGFAAGVGLGIGVGMLFAPANGQETRNSIADTFQDVGNRVRERFSEAERAAS